MYLTLTTFRMTQRFHHLLTSMLKELKFTLKLQ
jgi:hypothetical protein